VGLHRGGVQESTSRLMRLRPGCLRGFTGPVRQPLQCVALVRRGNPRINSYPKK
jgi:hypothetical protein